MEHSIYEQKIIVCVSSSWNGGLNYSTKLINDEFLVTGWQIFELDHINCVKILDKHCER
jgi:hypothetical protein